VPLAGVIGVPFPPRAEDIAAVEIELVPQVVDGLLLFLDSLLVDLTGLIECGPEIFGRGLEVFGLGLEIDDLLSVLAQQVVALVGISGP
jgi:hypothetical protein